MWLSGTGVAFACLCPCGVETLVAFARVGRASTETGVAFAGEKWVFLACFSVAEVLSVSAVVVEGRAVVMAVSRWPASVVAEAMLVSTVAVQRRAVVMVVSCGPASVVAVVSWVSKSPCHCVLSAKKFTPHGLVWAEAPHGHTQRMRERPGPWPRALEGVGSFVYEVQSSITKESAQQ